MSEEQDEKMIYVIEPGRRYAPTFGSDVLGGGYQFTLDGEGFYSIAQYYYYAKAKLFKVERSADLILNSVNQNDYRLLTKSIIGFDYKVWSDNRLSILLKACIARFGSDKELFNSLLEINSYRDIFIYADKEDCDLGIGITAKELEKGNNLRGINLYGTALPVALKYIAMTYHPSYFYV